MLTIDRLKEVLTYDPETGIFRWRITRKKCTPGAVAGNIRPDGYVLIRIDYLRYYAHHLAWLLTHGEWPEGELDHENTNPTDNRIQNLRPATRSENGTNRTRQKNNTSGYKGVHKYGKKWEVSAVKHGKRIRLQGFTDPKVAAAAYAKIAAQLHGEFARL